MASAELTIFARGLLRIVTSADGEAAIARNDGGLKSPDAHSMTYPIVVNEAPRFAPAGYLATHARPLINGTVAGAKYMEAFDLLIDAGGGKPDDLASKAEQTVHVKRGQLRGEVNGQAFSAVVGDWVFVPASARWTMQACGPGHVQALLLRAADFERDASERLTAFVRLSP